MRLTASRIDSRTAVGVVRPDGVHDTGADWDDVWSGRLDLTAISPDTSRPLPDGSPGIPLPAGAKLICVGLNYRQHAIESGAETPKSPVLFSKFANALVPADSIVPLPPVAKQYDYEAELGVVIGRRARNLTEKDALEAVLGYINCNDLSARDLQFKTGQWLLGKTLDAFLPIGPYLVTADEVPDPQALQIRCWVNGDLRQDSNTRDMIFGVAELVSYISHHFTLQPGDLISTGTPAGVAFGMPTTPWLQVGDVVDVELGDGAFGRLRSTFAATLD